MQSSAQAIEWPLEIAVIPGERFDSCRVTHEAATDGSWSRSSRNHTEYLVGPVADKPAPHIQGRYVTHNAAVDRSQAQAGKGNYLCHALCDPRDFSPPGSTRSHSLY